MNYWLRAQKKFWLKCMDEAKLAPIKVLVTRPEHQAQGLCQALEKTGATPLPFPVLEIANPQESVKIQATLQHIDTFDWLIFISANAVDRAFSIMQEADVKLPDSCKLAAVGRSTANKLKALNFENKIVMPAERFDSEGLLALDELNDVADGKILIIRGEGGRETLGEALKQRGAVVEYMEVYRRVKPDVKLDSLDKDRPDIAIVTSNQGLQNFWQMANKKQQQWLKKLPLVVMSERNRGYAKKIGYQGAIMVAPQQSDEGLLAALTQWRKKNEAGNSNMAAKKQQSSTPEAVKKKQLSSQGDDNGKAADTAQKEKFGKRLIIIIIILMVAAGSFAGYTLWLKFNQLEASVMARIEDYNGAQLKQLQSLKESVSDQNQKRLSLEKNIEKLQKENDLLWVSVRAVTVQNGYDKRPWQFAEAAYLMRLANHRLQLEKDIEGAIVGLQSADAILKEVADPALIGVREQLARELTQLKMLDVVDIEGVSAQLISLAENARQLPIKGIEVVELHVSDSNEASSQPEQWQGVVDRVWSEMRSLVVITRNDKPVAPLIPADQQSYLYHNIELQLESARLAMLKGEQKVWLSSLGYVKNWLYDYFDHEMPSVSNSVELINQLEKLNVSPTLPDISTSLRALQQQRETLLNNNGAPQSAPQPDESPVL